MKTASIDRKGQESGISKEQAQGALLRALAFFESDSTLVTERGLIELEKVRQFLVPEDGIDISRLIGTTYERMQRRPSSHLSERLPNISQMAQLVLDRFSRDSSPMPHQELRQIASACEGRKVNSMTFTLELLRNAGIIRMGPKVGSITHSPGPVADLYTNQIRSDSNGLEPNSKK